MKNIVLACFAFVAMSCAQQKTVVQSQQVQNHRYTTVYEGNKIITYEKQEVKELTLSKREKVNVAADETVLFLPKREKLEKLPVLAKRESQSRTNSTFSHNFKKSVISGLKQAKENSANADESTKKRYFATKTEHSCLSSRP